MNTKEKVLVTGANGLLGAHVVRALLNENYHVRVLIREGSDLRSLKGLDVEFFKGQVTKHGDVLNAAVGCDYIVHAAARTSQSPSELEAYWKANLLSTEYILNACCLYKIKRLVFVSTANCFGNGTKKEPGTENTPFLPWLKQSGYAYSKLLAQEKVLGEVRKNKLDAVVVNPTFLLGENDYKPSSGQIFFHIINKRVAFYPPGGKNFVDVEMAAKGVVGAMKKGKTGECYLLAGENQSYLEFFKKVKAITGQKTIFIALPKWLLLFVGWCGSFMERMFKIPVRLTYTNARMLCLGNYFSAQKAVKELEFKVVSSYYSAEKAILWFKDNMYFNSKK